MATSRRDLIKKSVLASAAALVVPELVISTEAAAAPRRATRQVRDTAPWLSRSIFEARLNEVFQVQIPGRGWVRARLIAVQDSPYASGPGVGSNQECFIAVFEGLEGIPQGTYSVNNNILGTFDLFLVPGGKRLRKNVTTATFFRLAA
jgi:hypothetical protein